MRPLPLRFWFLFLAICAPLLAAPEKWKTDIDALVAGDATHPPARDAVVFVGSSSIVKWKSLNRDFPFAVINRGFGGSELADSVAYMDRIVIAYHPRAVVLYAGDNDIAGGKQPEAVLADFNAFEKRLHEQLPGTRLFYLSIKYSPSRAAFQPAMRRANQLIADACAKAKNTTFVDVNALMLDSAGQPRAELFEKDQLHMKPETYAIWTKALLPLLQP
jgi:lysophospholipase L1-like esterase